MGNRPIIVAVDGPAGAGKSTAARRLAEHLGFTLVDTGAIYRTVALAAGRRGVAFDDEAALAEVVRTLEVGFRFEGGVNRVFLAGEDVTEAIRTPEISMGASTVSARPAVRSGLLGLQRRLALGTDAPGAVLEGRDIGTVVFPDADVKIFLTARPEIRARRRFDELVAKGVEADYDAVLQDQIARDRQDATREVAPLKPADDAHVVDSSDLGLEAVVDRLAGLVPSAA